MGGRSRPGEHGHAPGHVCLPVSGRADLSNLVETLSNRYGEYKALVEMFDEGLFDGFRRLFMPDELIKRCSQNGSPISERACQAS